MATTPHPEPADITPAPPATIAFRTAVAIDASHTFTTEQAVNVCQDSVRQQALNRFRGRRVEFLNARIDDNPGGKMTGSSARATSSVFLIARLFRGQTLQSAAATTPPPMPYQRGQFWVRRFRAQVEALCVALVALTQPAPAPDLLDRALAMLESTGWIAAHRFLFAGVRSHLLGWPRGLAPNGRRAAVSSAAAPA